MVSVEWYVMFLCFSFFSKLAEYKELPVSLLINAITAFDLSKSATHRGHIAVFFDASHQAQINWKGCGRKGIRRKTFFPDYINTNALCQ